MCGSCVPGCRRRDTACACLFNAPPCRIRAKVVMSDGGTVRWPPTLRPLLNPRVSRVLRASRTTAGKRAGVQVPLHEPAQRPARVHLPGDSQPPRPGASGRRRLCASACSRGCGCHVGSAASRHVVGCRERSPSCQRVAAPRCVQGVHTTCVGNEALVRGGAWLTAVWWHVAEPLQ